MSRLVESHEVRPGDLVSVAWVDSVTFHGWTTDTPLDHDLTMTTVGWVWYALPDRLIIAGSVGRAQPRNWLGPIHIPREAIKGIRRLSVPPEDRALQESLRTP